MNWNKIILCSKLLSYFRDSSIEPLVLVPHCFPLNPSYFCDYLQPVTVPVRTAGWRGHTICGTIKLFIKVIGVSLVTRWSVLLFPNSLSPVQRQAEIFRFLDKKGNKCRRQNLDRHLRFLENCSVKNIFNARKEHQYVPSRSTLFLSAEWFKTMKR